MDPKVREYFLYTFSSIIIVFFFVVVMTKIIKGQDVQLEVGALIGYTGAAVQYFLGSSKSSSDKTAIIAKQMDKIDNANK